MTPKQKELCTLMDSCMQFGDYSTLQHGLDCYKYFKAITSNTIVLGKTPRWLSEYHEQITKNLHDIDTCEKYIIFHDCGKHRCLTKDENGQSHFYDHAAVSKEVFQEYFENDVASKLIGFDMAIHTMKDNEISDYLNQWNIKDACTLLLTGLSEIYANSDLFGGVDSTSFKIKFKQIEKRGNAICKRLFGESNEI